MNDVVNLNKVRKARQKADRQQVAAQNRVVYGLSTKIRKLSREQERVAAGRLDQNRIEANGHKAEKDEL